MSKDCPERRRLTNKLAEAINTVSALRKSEKNDATPSILLQQMSTAMRNAEESLDQHLKQHGCLEGEKLSK